VPGNDITIAYRASFPDDDDCQVAVFFNGNLIHKVCRHHTKSTLFLPFCSCVSVSVCLCLCVYLRIDLLLASLLEGMDTLRQSVAT